jgi:hypothetical protein
MRLATRLLVARAVYRSACIWRNVRSGTWHTERLIARSLSEKDSGGEERGVLIPKHFCLEMFGVGYAGNVSKRFRTCDLDQVFLLPPALQDWLPEEHLSRFIADVTDQLDLSEILAVYARKDGRGMAAYHPAMMVRVFAVRLLPGGGEFAQDRASHL